MRKANTLESILANTKQTESGCVEWTKSLFPDGYAKGEEPSEAILARQALAEWEAMWSDDKETEK